MCVKKKKKQKQKQNKTLEWVVGLIPFYFEPRVISPIYLSFQNCPSIFQWDINRIISNNQIDVFLWFFFPIW